MRSDLTRLLVDCPDRPGIVAAVAGFLAAAGANIVSSHQHTSPGEDGSFFLRVEFEMASDADGGADLARRFEAEVGAQFAMTWRTWQTRRPKRVAVLASRDEHCLLDLLWRHRRGELEAEIDLVVSNHEDLRGDVEAFGIRFAHVPVHPGGKPQAEAQILKQLAGRYDLVVLARYMQILSEDFLVAVGAPVINIHHSFLPAFAGAGPYERARERGVKLIGATAHYVTAELDAGPIIEQDVIRVSHEQDATSLKRLGADIERVVLARAVKWHCEDRVVWHADNTTIVF